METPVNNVRVIRVTFFGHGGPTSGELIMSVDQTPDINPGDGTTVFSYRVANLSEARPDKGPRQVYEAARLIIKAYMQEDLISLEYVSAANSFPWVTKITCCGEGLDLEPGPVLK